jgi:hypothetical protein
MEPSIRINPSQLEAGEERIIADRVFEVLSKPPHIPKPSGPPSLDISGQWDLQMDFSASTVSQRFVFEQNGNDLIGTHYGSLAARDFAGTLYGRDILIRSSYTSNGVRLNFEFTGIVSDAMMEGTVSLGEYGMAHWKAKRREY